MRGPRVAEVAVDGGSGNAAVPPVHAKWWLDRIGTHQFDPIHPAAVMEEIWSWANDQDWTEGYGGQSIETMTRLRDQVFTLLHSGQVYQLHAPKDVEAIHCYGASLGATGLLEFLVIDRDHHVVHLIIASDD